MVGMVGADRAGMLLLQTLRGAGVNTQAVRKTTETPTGMALVTVDERGENMIVVSPGANGTLTPADVEDAASVLLQDAAVTLLQLEIRTDTVAAAARLSSGTVILNPAPARSLEAGLLADVDVLIPNRTELGILAGAGDGPVTIDDAADLAGSLQGPAAVVVTLGADGALLVDDAGTHHVPSVPVDVVDPTGAGDAFCAGMADALVRGATTREAVEWAVLCGAAATRRWGAQAALPARGEVEALERLR